MTFSIQQWVRGSMAAAVGAALAVAGGNTWAATDMTIWHTLSGTQAASFTALVDQFNRDQKDVKVSLQGFKSKDELKAQLAQAAVAKKLPTWVQWTGSDAPTLYSMPGLAFENVEELVKPASPDAAKLSAAAAAPFLDHAGRWQALPLTPAVPLIMYRTEVIKKVGLDPLNLPTRSWKDLQSVLVRIRDNGVACGIASVDPAWVHIENLASWNNQPYASKNNGVGGKPDFVFNDLLHVRHFALMVSWAKSDLMVVKKDRGAEPKWASGDCPMAIGPSTLMADVGTIETSKLAVAPMPLWEEVSTLQGGYFPDGDGLYLPEPVNAETKKAVQKFGAWWFTPVVAAEWHQRSGSVPMTEAAYLATKKGGYYNSVPGWESLSARLAAPGGKLVTPMKLDNRRKVLNIIEAELEQSYFSGKAPKAALDDSVRLANALEMPAHTVASKSGPSKKAKK